MQIFTLHFLLLKKLKRFSFCASTDTYVVVGEPNPFFESSSELATSFACRNGNPRLKRLDADELLLLVLGVDVLAAVELASREDSLDDRLPCRSEYHIISYINTMIQWCFC